LESNLMADLAKMTENEGSNSTTALDATAIWQTDEAVIMGQDLASIGTSGFPAILGGGRGLYGFSDCGSVGIWWCAVDQTQERRFFSVLSNNELYLTIGELKFDKNAHETDGYAVRCVKDK